MKDSTPCLSNRVALITGASSGIGKAIAERLYNEGAIVVNADKDEPEKGNAFAQGRYFFYKTDITSGEEVQQLYQCVSKQVGKPSILVCNAGRGVHEKISEGDPEKWFSVINVNIMGTLRVLRSFLPDLLLAPHPEIVFISSVAAQSPYEYGAVYSASKAALDMIAATLRLELKEAARVTVIAPGVVDTAFFQNMESGGLSVDKIGLGAISPSEVADSVAFALSRNKEFVINNIILRPVKQVL